MRESCLPISYNNLLGGLLTYYAWFHLRTFAYTAPLPGCPPRRGSGMSPRTHGDMWLHFYGCPTDWRCYRQSALHCMGKSGPMSTYPFQKANLASAWEAQADPPCCHWVSAPTTSENSGPQPSPPLPIHHHLFFRASISHNLRSFLLLLSVSTSRM